MVLAIIIGGKHGDGFSAQALSPELVKRVPTILRDVANQIDAGGARSGYVPPQSELN